MVETKLGEIAELLKTGKTPPSKKAEYFNGKVKWYTPGDFGNDKKLNGSNRTVTQLAVDENKAVIFPENSLLVTCIGDIGKIGITTECSSSNQQITAIKPKKEVDVNYLYYWFFKNKSRLANTANNAVVPILNNGSLKEINFSYPPLKTQQKIAAILDEADKLRQLDKKLIKKYEALSQSLFLEMFGNVRINSRKFKEIRFDKVIFLKRGYDLPTNSRMGGDVPVVASTGIAGYHNETKVTKDCIVTGRSGSIGKVQLITGSCWPLNTSLYSKETYDNNLTFLKFFLQFFDLKRFSRGAGVPTLDRKLVHSEMVPNIPLELQLEFANQMKIIEDQRGKINDGLKCSEELFNSLLQKAFKGELV